MSRRRFVCGHSGRVPVGRSARRRRCIRSDGTVLTVCPVQCIDGRETRAAPPGPPSDSIRYDVACAGDPSDETSGGCRRRDERRENRLGAAAADRQVAVPEVAHSRHTATADTPQCNANNREQLGAETVPRRHSATADTRTQACSGEQWWPLVAAGIDGCASGWERARKQQSRSIRSK